MKSKIYHHFPEILNQWFVKNPEAVLCQRNIDQEITFDPVYVTKANEDEIEFIIPSIFSRSLNISKKFFKTITLVSHKSTKSNPNQNKGFFIVCYVESLNEVSFGIKTSYLNVWKDQKLILVKLKPIRSSFWAGIRFGSYSWQKIPPKIPKLFKKPKIFPNWRRARKLSELEKKTLTFGHFLYIAVITKRGYIHVTPVHFVAIKNRIFLATSFTSSKLKNFKISNISVAYSYITEKGKSDFTSAITIRGQVFLYGWNFITALAYGILFGPYLGFVTLRMYLKYPTTIKNFPTRQTPYRWNFIPLLGRTFIEYYWQEDQV